MEERGEIEPEDYIVIPFMIRNRILLEQKRKLEDLIGHPSLMYVGAANGYVAVLPGHPLYKVDCDVIEEYINIHGGLTFSGWGNQLHLADFVNDQVLGVLANTTVSNLWCFGFDTIHYNSDEGNFADITRVWEETLKLAEQLRKVRIIN